VKVMRFPGTYFVLCHALLHSQLECCSSWWDVPVIRGLGHCEVTGEKAVGMAAEQRERETSRHILRFSEIHRDDGHDMLTGLPTLAGRPKDRTTPIGQMIDSYLKSQLDMDDHVIHLLFSANRWEAAYDTIPWSPFPVLPTSHA
jgi:hypothetical protein